MKRAFFVGLLIFSLLVNASVGVVIARHWWHEKKYNAIESTECPALSSEDVQKISKSWSGDTKMGIMKTRRELQSKRAEVLDLIASSPGNLEPAQSAIHELINLRGFGKPDIGTHKPDNGLSSSRKAYGLFGVPETQNLQNEGFPVGV